MLICAGFAKAEIYKYRDKNGVIHFTDSPVGVPADKKPQIYKEIRNSGQPGDAKDGLIDAGVAYREKDYQKAIVLYTQIFESEKKHPVLSITNWRIVVDHLGTSYGHIGNNLKAKEIFEYGISKDKKYALFYYNLARVYAEMDDFVKCITNLRKAYEYKEGMTLGERFPDPATDPSFSRFMKREVFRRLVEQSRK